MAKMFNSENYKSYFAWENYHKLDEHQRQELLEFTVEQTRQDKGLKDVDVSFQNSSPSLRGSCSPRIGMGGQCKGHKMVLNSDVLTSQNVDVPYGVYNTINHELEHASQYEKASNRRIGNDNSEVLEQRLNDEHYYSSAGDKIDVSTGRRTARFDGQTDYQLYRAQACEADARAAGLNAVEDLEKTNRANGIKDEHAQDYIETAKADEVVNNREMMSKLGMHSRENMAREELEHIPLKQVSRQERKEVLDYAREKDYETAKTVLSDDSRGQATEQQMRQQFNENSRYKDFYQTDRYESNKVNDSERKNYKYSTYKWDSEDESKETKDTVSTEETQSKSTQQKSGDNRSDTYDDFQVEQNNEQNNQSHKH